jgi:hypothetical protein
MLLNKKGLNDWETYEIREIGCEDVNWIKLAQDKIQWRASVMMVMNLWVP